MCYPARIKWKSILVKLLTKINLEQNRNTWMYGVKGLLQLEDRQNIVNVSDQGSFRREMYLKH